MHEVDFLHEVEFLHVAGFLHAVEILVFLDTSFLSKASALSDMVVESGSFCEEVSELLDDSCLYRGPVS